MDRETSLLSSRAAVLKVRSVDARDPWHFDRGSMKSGVKLVVYAVNFRESHLAILVECHCVNHRQCTSSGH